MLAIPLEENSLAKVAAVDADLEIGGHIPVHVQVDIACGRNLKHSVFKGKAQCGCDPCEMQQWKERCKEFSSRVLMQSGRTNLEACTNGMRVSEI